MLTLFYEIKEAHYTEEFPELPDNFDFDKFENNVHKILKSFK